MRASRRTSGHACSWASDRRRAVLGAAALHAVILGAWACREPPTSPITLVRVRETTRAPEAALDRARVEAWAGAAVGRIEGLAVRAAAVGERRWQLDVAVGRRAFRGARPEDGGVLPPDRLWREVEVGLELRALDRVAADAGEVRLGGARYAAWGRAAENVGVFDDDAALVERAVGEAARDLAEVIRLEVLPDAAVVAQIVEGQGLARRRAVEAAGARRLGSAVAALVALVPDTALGGPATGALVAIGDPRATEALIESARERPLVSIVFAVAQLGGTQAEAWLFTLSSGHPDPHVRAAAVEALAELERRASRRGPAPAPSPAP